MKSENLSKNQKNPHLENLNNPFCVLSILHHQYIIENDCFVENSFKFKNPLIGICSNCFIVPIFKPNRNAIITIGNEKCFPCCSCGKILKARNDLSNIMTPLYKEEDEWDRGGA